MVAASEGLATSSSCSGNAASSKKGSSVGFAPGFAGGLIFSNLGVPSTVVTPSLLCSVLEDLDRLFLLFCFLFAFLAWVAGIAVTSRRPGFESSDFCALLTASVVRAPSLTPSTGEGSMLAFAGLCDQATAPPLVVSSPGTSCASRRSSSPVKGSAPLEVISVCVAISCISSLGPDPTVVAHETLSVLERASRGSAGGRAGAEAVPTPLRASLDTDVSLPGALLGVL